jgi:hypothetical protein
MNSFFQQRPFILGIFFLRKTWQSSHKSSNKIILFATRTRPHIILLKIHPKKNHNKLKKKSTKSKREKLNSNQASNDSATIKAFAAILRHCFATSQAQRHMLAIASVQICGAATATTRRL